MNKKDVILVGVDIYEFVKGLCDRLLGESPYMTCSERKAYFLGINNTLLLLNQALNEAILEPEFKSDIDEYIAVHIQKLKVMEEFSSIEEIINRN